jgi:hypothetical protein
MILDPVDDETYYNPWLCSPVSLRSLSMGFGRCLGSLTEAFRIQRYQSRLATLPVRRIPAGLAPINERCHFWTRPGTTGGCWVGRGTRSLCDEHNGRFTANFDSARRSHLGNGPVSFGCHKREISFSGWLLRLPIK